MSIKRDLKTLSKQGWTTESATNTDLQTSCLMRIADATEATAKSYVQLQKDAAFWEREFQHERARRQSLERSIVAHKSNYTRLKNKLEAMKSDVQSS
jgi:septal ring factor EnvC (AmiA/AmiB activator)